MGQKRLVRRLWYPPLMQKKYRDTKPFETMEIFLKKFFETVGQKIFDGESWYPSRCYLWKIATQEWFFSELPSGSTTKFLGTVTHWTFDRKSWYPPPLNKVFWYPEIFPNTWVALGNASPRWGNIISTGIRDMLHLLWYLTVFDSRNYLKHRTIPLRNVSVRWDK